MDVSYMMKMFVKNFCKLQNNNFTVTVNSRKKRMFNPLFHGCKIKALFTSTKAIELIKQF